MFAMSVLEEEEEEEEEERDKTKVSELLTGKSGRRPDW